MRVTWKLEPEPRSGNQGTMEPWNVSRFDSISTPSRPNTSYFCYATFTPKTQQTIALKIGHLAALQVHSDSIGKIIFCLLFDYMKFWKLFFLGGLKLR